MSDGSISTGEVFIGIISGMSAIGIPFMGWLGNRLVKKIDKTSDDLAAHEKESTRTFATNAQLDRVHQRIDESDKKADGNFKEMRDKMDEIKTLLINGVHR